MEINYQEMCSFYKDIYDEIFSYIEQEFPAIYETKSGKIIFSDEYLKAMGALQRVNWSINDIMSLRKYFGQESFKYFGLESLSGIRYDLGKYLKYVDYVNFGDIREIITKYDKMLTKYQQERKITDVEYYFDFYSDLLQRQVDVDEALNSITLIISDLENMSERIKNTTFEDNTEIRLINKRLKRNTADLKAELKRMEEEILTPGEPFE